MGVQSPKLFSENNHSVIFTANIQKCPKTCNTWVGGGPESQTNTWNFVRKISHFFKKIKCSKQPKKQNKPNFHLSLSGIPNMRGGWVGLMFGTKSQTKPFFLTTSLISKITYIIISHYHQVASYYNDKQLNCSYQPLHYHQQLSQQWKNCYYPSR